MFQVLIGAVFGFFGGFVLFVAILLSDIKLDVSIATNIIIALATVIATVIHFSSIKQQRKDRLWDINKPILLDLSHTLSSVIKASEFYLQEEYARNHIDDAPKASDAPDANVFKAFKEKQEYALNVYKTLMSQELISALENAKRINENIDHGVNEYGVDHITAYEESISTNQALKEKLDFFIAKMSGVNDI
ncbi:hypothetical protein IC617_14575 [Neiella sp. HB171785]|uniref:Uncharacterized protein n=1 Tax=Neiella litorisoli TaxID=2771431 RepID=A0A8J6UME2_9GAMM|nr:hypothetical protein [Neiella litorisoli]MBD1390660.1 hypothetical protein [Neiella litorisoli]